MKLNRLLATQSWEEVWATLLRLYPDQEEGIEHYRYVFETLNTLNPDETTMRICIEAIVDEDTGATYHDVSGKDGTLHKEQIDGPEEFRQGDLGDQEVSWAIEIRDWAEWLGMEIDPDTLTRYAEPDIIAHCLWEMTYFGFTPENIGHTWEEIKQSRGSGKTYSLERLKELVQDLDWWEDTKDEDDPKQEFSGG